MTDTTADDRLAVFYRSEVLDHDTGWGFFEAPCASLLPVAERHPENADRIRNMEAILRDGPIAPCIDWFSAGPASEQDLLRFHQAAYVEYLSSLDPTRTHRLTATTPLGPGGYDVALLAAGVAMAAVNHVWQRRGKTAYALVRPPGHHAQPSMADGYCFVNNIGVAIEAARQEGLQRAVVIDWDVHHGNGTQEGYYQDDAVLTISMHMDHGAWGETHVQGGAVEEVGSGSGAGCNVNIPLPSGAGDEFYEMVFDQIVRPLAVAHQPELVIIAAGQDASQFDPNGRMCLSMAGFHSLGARARMLANEVCAGRLALVQEGGYATSYASYCLHATLEGVRGRQNSLDDPLSYMPPQIENPQRSVDELISRRESALRNR
jgi:acetoin utilization deacetylase AcuC-like enzyme